MAADERIGGAPVTRVEMRAMSLSMIECELYDLKSTFSFYTWNNKHEHEGKFYSRIDRVFINDVWLNVFPGSVAHFLPERLFDHCHCLVRFDEAPIKRKAPFKYYNMWSKAQGFEDLITDRWGMNVMGSEMFKIVTKLKGFEKDLRMLNREQFSDIENLVRVPEISLDHFQTKLREDPLNEELCRAEKECAKEVEFLGKARIDFLKQKAKMKWMNDGDDNSAFFHSIIKRRRAMNTVYQIKDIRGVLCTQPDTIKAAFEEFYVSLLGTSKHVEVQEAMLSISGDKAPGPDEVYGTINKVSLNGKLLKQCNNTVLTLVPKVEVPENVMQFRPIACCNTIYKCLSKVICKRMSLILPDIVSTSQGAFIKGRDIVGNILICQDLIRLYKRKTCSPRMMMKLDLHKAYDSIEWSFIEEILTGLGFPERMMNKDKSSVYCNGMVVGLVQEIEQATGMKRGNTPFKYLGVSVSPKRLSVLDCQCLVDKVVSRIKAMGSRHISYAGRAILISSVFSTLHNYWACIFIIPKTVIRKIDSICKDFIWCGKTTRDSPALVDWEKLCRPKKQGGLGFKNLMIWNLAVIAKYVWWIENKEDHLWVKWVHAIYIRDKSWCDYEPISNSSWAWRKICHSKNLMKPLFYDETWRALQVPYSIRMGYSWLLPDSDNVPWYPWWINKWVVPKHGFIGWLMAQHRLLTQDRLQSMNVIQSNQCYLCGIAAENHNHLFFQCEYSKQCSKCVSDCGSATQSGGGGSSQTPIRGWRCFNCNKIGHRAFECKSAPRGSSEGRNQEGYRSPAPSIGSNRNPRQWSTQRSYNNRQGNGGDQSNEGKIFGTASTVQGNGEKDN
ncbi:uncharacterized protein LOC141595105 [Silene latifolia]|uniref:uncharacterized protein LOC141595105 n=1 Tax=Silene latifolia TaxID=37657 RepID=UPI003D77A7C1